MIINAVFLYTEEIGHSCPYPLLVTYEKPTTLKQADKGQDTESGFPKCSDFKLSNKCRGSREKQTSQQGGMPEAPDSILLAAQ